MVCVGGYVGDELLRREGEEAREGERGRGWGEAGEEEVVVCYCVGDLDMRFCVSVNGEMVYVVAGEELAGGEIGGGGRTIGA